MQDLWLPQLAEGALRWVQAALLGSLAAGCFAGTLTVPDLSAVRALLLAAAQSLPAAVSQTVKAQAAALSPGHLLLAWVLVHQMKAPALSCSSGWGPSACWGRRWGPVSAQLSCLPAD